MREISLNAFRLSGAILMFAGLFGCEIAAPLGVDGARTSGSRSAVDEAPVEIRISDVRSGMPERPAGVIDLRDEHLWIEILDVESYLPRSATANALRLGETWETGTSAERLQLVDLDADGRRDVRIWFSLPRLVDEERIGAGTTGIVLWGKDPRTGETYRAAAAVSIAEPPPARGSVTGRVVFAGSGTPVVGAGVGLLAAPHATGTDADGRFELGDVPAGEYALEVWRNGILGRQIDGVLVPAGGTVDVGDVVATPVSNPWPTTASSMRGRNGERFTIVCPAGGTSHAVWGTDLYTDDSSVCVAAVHVGAIGFTAGGTVTFEIRPGSSGYDGSLRNGVQSIGWGGSWGGSFVIVDAP
jgi:hypothetical protein